ncbi:hypothetical protein PVAND_015269 [Polypedilum vanderplanki]|uniref:TEP1-F n=1 Tax=Polypedilum vanderplanki TaxID=319348 RepID=A0A9J6BCK6_POLVA|nr:hypothetical protein PVAND_015269 [Polypedilum vanderplanki]
MSTSSSSNTSSSNDYKNFFTVIGSNLVRANDIYTVSIYCSNYETSQKLEVSLKGRGSNDDYDKLAFKESKTVTLNGTQTQFLNFKLNHSTDVDYILEAKTLDGESFKSSKALNLNTKKSSIFIQTDKATYKPGDVVKFRILMLDDETKPVKLPSDANIEVFITDSGDNRVKQYDDVKFNKAGVYQNEMQLSDSPLLGTWKLHINVGNEKAEKELDVAEYVLPKFEVTIDSKSDACYKDEKIKATVKAKYTFGKIAKGKAVVTAEVEEKYGIYRNSRHHKSQKVSKSVDVDGEKFVEFDIKDDLKITDYSHECTVKLEAVYTDTLSKKEVKAETKVTIHVTPYKLELKKSSEKFKPELPFYITAIVKAHDKNAPITDEKNPLKFVVTSYYEVLKRIKANPNEIIAGKRMKAGEDYECWEENFREHRENVSLVNGVAKLNVQIQKDIKYFHVKATYLENEEEINHIEKAESDSNEYLVARLATENPKLNEIFKIEVLATTELQRLSYNVFGRGKLIESNSVAVENSKTHTLEIKSTVMMIPKAYIVVYYLTNDGEIVSDKTEIEFGNELINYVDLSLSKETAKPGEDFEISVKTKPNSFVGLLGVDQSVLLLKSGNDIEPSAVFEELGKYGETTKHNYSCYNDYENSRKFNDFTNCQSVIITNAKSPHTNRDQVMFKRYKPGFGGGMLFGSRHDDELMMANIRPMAMMSMRSMSKSAAPEAFAMCDSVPIEPFKPKVIEIRKEFPETFIWDTLEFDNSNGSKTLSKKVPDTITSWIITGFSIDPLTGLGLTKQPTKLNVFQPFFASTNLPYSIKRGEVISISIDVFNYLETDQNAQVTLYNKDHEFEFVNSSDDNPKDSLSIKKQNVEVERKKMVLLKANEGTAISFLIKALKVGDILIKVVAESATAGDGLERYLKVEPEGITIHKNEAVFIDLRKEQKFNRKIDIDVPENVILDSTKVEVSIIGDVLGPSIDNLDKLIRMPYGCGEQNMLNFVPNIVVLEYLTTLKKLTPEVEAKCKKFMEVGYQRELTYRHRDGSYSAFGSSDRSGSTWLTAFVAKSFTHASKYIHIDENNVNQALEFLTKVQKKDGSFPEVGTVFHSDMQGGSSKGIALTAYTLITFLENEKSMQKYQEVIQKALNYIVENEEDLKDIYSLAIATYAFQLANHEHKKSFIARLDKMSVSKDGLKYWSKEEPKDEESDNFWRRKDTNSINVEMSAYALQALLEAGQESEAVPIMKWLVTQRNANGGFQSTQDTVVGLQALSRLATRIYVPNSEISITVKSKSDNKAQAQMTLNAGNALVLQKQELSSNERHFEVEATGKGFSILQISYKYNIDDSGKFPRFTLKPKVEEPSNKEFLQLSVCTSFVPDAQAEKSNMAVMEVTLPSGFTFDSDSLAELLATDRVKKVETKEGETIVMVYFDDIDSKEICPVFKAYRTHAVAKQKPVPVVIYDYYDNTRRATEFYIPPEISISDIE